MLPDGRERRVECGEAFVGLGARKRDAEQAAAAKVLDWFVDAGLWERDALDAPPPVNIGLVRARAGEGSRRGEGARDADG